MPDKTLPSGLFISGDLMLGGAVIAAMEQRCSEVTRALSGRGLLQRLQDRPVDLMVLDLEAADLDLPGLGQLTRQHGRPLIVAYAPHVATERMQSAHDAGFAAVITRGQASSQLSEILRRVWEQRPKSDAQ